jgi:gluconolactonase
MADGFGRLNGICFSPDEKSLYVTDTDWIGGDETTDDMRPSTMYASFSLSICTLQHPIRIAILCWLRTSYVFDVSIFDGQPFLANRRLLAMADTTIPDGIKCDLAGNVYSGCGDGVNVWSPGGVLLGRILVEGGVANFCFGKDGEMYLFNENRLWRAKLNGKGVKGALLGI